MNTLPHTIHFIQNLNDSAISNCHSRRLNHQTEIIVQQKWLTQLIDIDPNLEGNTTKENMNMPDYPTRSVENTLHFIQKLFEAKIFNVALRFRMTKRDNNNNPRTALLEHAKALGNIRNHFPKEKLWILVDPFDLALNSNLSWGILGPDGSLDYRESLLFLAEVAVTFGRAGANAVLTLGRMEREVLVTRMALNEAGLNSVLIASFSVNSETSQAYNYLPKYENGLDTKQKLLCGNQNEMILRSILDIHEGTNEIIVKPSDNYHTILSLVHTLSSKENIKNFLSSPLVTTLSKQRTYVSQTVTQILSNIEDFYQLCVKCTLSVYTISGIYYNDMDVECRQGAGIAAHVVNERMLNIASCFREWPGECHILDRIIYRYTQNFSTVNPSRAL